MSFPDHLTSPVSKNKGGSNIEGKPTPPIAIRSSTSLSGRQVTTDSPLSPRSALAGQSISPPNSPVSPRGVSFGPTSTLNKRVSQSEPGKLPFAKLATFDPLAKKPVPPKPTSEAVKEPSTTPRRGSVSKSPSGEHTLIRSGEQALVKGDEDDTKRRRRTKTPPNKSSISQLCHSLQRKKNHSKSTMTEGDFLKCLGDEKFGVPDLNFISDARNARKYEEEILSQLQDLTADLPKKEMAHELLERGMNALGRWEEKTVEEASEEREEESEMEIAINDSTRALLRSKHLTQTTERLMHDLYFDKSFLQPLLDNLKHVQEKLKELYKANKAYTEKSLKLMGFLQAFLNIFEGNQEGSSKHDSLRKLSPLHQAVKLIHTHIKESQSLLNCAFGKELKGIKSVLNDFATLEILTSKNLKKVRQARVNGKLMQENPTIKKITYPPVAMPPITDIVFEGNIDVTYTRDFQLNINGELVSVNLAVPQGKSLCDLGDKSKRKMVIEGIYPIFLEKELIKEIDPKELENVLKYPRILLSDIKDPNLKIFFTLLKCTSLGHWGICESYLKEVQQLPFTTSPYKSKRGEVVISIQSDPKSGMFTIIQQKPTYLYKNDIPRANFVYELETVLDKDGIPHGFVSIEGEFVTENTTFKEYTEIKEHLEPKKTVSARTPMRGRSKSLSKPRRGRSKSKSPKRGESPSRKESIKRGDLIQRSSKAKKEEKEI